MPSGLIRYDPGMPTSGYEMEKDGECNTSGGNNVNTDLMVISAVSPQRNSSRSGSRRLASVIYKCHCGNNYTPLKKDDSGYFVGCDRACSPRCVKDAPGPKNKASPVAQKPRDPVAVQRWMRRHINDYANSKISMIMAARVPSADGAHDTLIIGADDEDIASILRYFLLLKATGTTHSIRTLRSLAMSCKDGTADGFFRLASERLGGIEKPTRKYRPSNALGVNVYY